MGQKAERSSTAAEWFESWLPGPASPPCQQPAGSAHLEDSIDLLYRQKIGNLDDCKSGPGL